MREMAAAWQMTVERRMGMFSPDPDQPSPLAAASGEDIPLPNPPNTAPHDIWTLVGFNKNLLSTETLA